MSWDEIDDIYTDEWTWDDASWEFGPQDKFQIEYMNGTEIDETKEFRDALENFKETLIREWKLEIIGDWLQKQFDKILPYKK